MKFRAMVADPKDGREFVTQIPADDEMEARRLLKQRGLLISSIEPAASQTSEVAATVGPQKPPVAVITREEKERYPAMTALSSVLRLIAIAAYIGGCLSIALAFLIAFDVSWQKDHPGMIPSAFGVLGGQLLFSGLIFHAIGHGLIALRDIAENSFRD